MKTNKIVIWMFLIVMLLCNIWIPSYAAQTGGTDAPGGGGSSGITIGGLDIGAFKPGTLTGEDTNEAFSLIKTIVSGLTFVGMILSVIMVMILGIKYMVGSIEQKAEYKKTMFPMLIGMILIFSTSAIVSIIFNIVYNGMFLKGWL